MVLLVTCPNGHALKVKDESAGKKGKCPRCGVVVLVPVLEQDGAADAIVAESPPLTASDSATSSPPANRNLVGATDSSGESLASLALQALRENQPPVDDVYVPSGNTTVRGLLLLSLGALIGIPVGAAAGALFALIGAVFAGLFFALALLLRGGAKLLFLAIAAVIAVSATLIAFGVAGEIVSKFAVRFSRLGKNRSKLAAVLASAIPAIIAALILPHLLRWVAMSLSVEWLLKAVQFAFDGTTGFVLTTLGVVVAVGMAALGAANLVGQDKFCEDCDTRMAPVVLPAMSLDATKVFVSSLTEGVVVFPDTEPAKTRSNGICVVYKCPRCGRGIANVVVRFSAKSKTDFFPGVEHINEAWLVASMYVAPTVAAALEAVVDRHRAS